MTLTLREILYVHARKPSPRTPATKVPKVSEAVTEQGERLNHAMFLRWIRGQAPKLLGRLISCPCSTVNHVLPGARPWATG